MFSRTFALFLRALRVDARLLHSHLMRLVLLAFLGSMLLVTHVFFSPVMGAPGLWFFTLITWVNFAFATLAAAFLFAAAITEEKEERTLGLLRMANVGPLTLLIGKGAPRLVAAVLILCVQFPFTLLAITLGGISWDQVMATFCTILAHVVLVGGLALFFSVVFRKTGSAIGLTAVIMIGLIAIPPFVNRVFTVGSPPAWIRLYLPFLLPALQTIVDASAAPRLYAILLTGFNEGPLGFQVLSNLAAGGVLFLLAWVLFDPCNRNPDDDVEKSSPLKSLIFRSSRTSRRAWRLAIVGKDFRTQAGGWKTLTVKFVVYLSLAVLIACALNDFRWSRTRSEDIGAVLMGFIFYLLFPIELMLLAARLFRLEIKDRTWSILLSLPLSLPEIAYAKLAGSLMAIIPCLFYFSVGVLLDWDDFSQLLRDILEEPNRILLISLYFAHLLLFVHLTTLFSVISNAWAGALLAIVTLFMGAFINLFVVNLPIMYIQLSSSGMGMSPDTMDIYYMVAQSLSLAVILGLTGCVHYMIGVRLKSAAAQ